MKVIKFNRAMVENLIRKVFPDSNIESHERFSNGLVSPTFKVKIKNPSRYLVVKIGKLKKKQIFNKNNLILNYLNDNGIPSPKVFYSGINSKKFVTIMDYSSGEVASKVYKDADFKLRKKILLSSGKNLRLIHKLKITSFWMHQRHEMKNKKEWKRWTKLRIDKYLNFFKRKFSDHYDFLEKELNEVWKILKKENIDFVPLHWDFHLANLNVNYEGHVTGIFDFDNAMKGHSLADLGQTRYWLWFELDEKENFKYLLKGYKKNFTNNELKLIRGYFILHLLAVSRSIWFKKSLRWIIDKHIKIIENLKNEKI